MPNDKNVRVDEKIEMVMYEDINSAATKQKVINKVSSKEEKMNSFLTNILRSDIIIKI